MTYEDNMVSIITPTYNSGKTLLDTVNSILSQSYNNWELIITDDHSSDDSYEIAKQLSKQDPRIQAYRLSSNRGPAAARNNSINKAKGRYLAFLDSDDLWLPEKLQRQILFHRRTKTALSFTTYREVNKNGSIRKKIIDATAPCCVGYTDLLKKKARMGCLTVMVDRAATGPFYMPDLRSGQDYATWLMLLKAGNSCHKLDECLSLYRIVSGSVSRNKLKKSLSQWRIYRTVERLNRIEAARYFSSYAWRALGRY